MGLGDELQINEVHVRQDLEVLKMLLNWSRLAKDRESWRDKTHQILGHTQLSAGNISTD